MIRALATLALLLAGVIAGLAIVVGLNALAPPLIARLLAAAGALILLWLSARTVAVTVAGLRARRRIRRERREADARVEARLAEVRELTPTDELERAVDPTPGTVRRARQERGKRTPRERKRRTGRWG